MATKQAEMEKFMQGVEKRRGALAESIKKQGQALLKDAFREFLAEHPEILALRWDQYTPHFNDGDACVFSVNELQVRVSGIPDDFGENDDGFVGVEYGNLDPLIDGPSQYNASTNDWERVRDATPEEKALGKKAKAEVKAAARFWKAVQDDDVFLAVFGDHVQVTVTRKGFRVEEYEHD